MPVILATQEAEIKRITKPAQANSSARAYVEKPFTKIGLVELLKLKTQRSSPSTTKKEKKKF
jgi:hypothetical protein